MARRRMIQAIGDALFEEMERNDKIIVFGEDVELAIMGETRGLLERFGPDRVRNTPISEATLTGMALGLAASGYHAVLHMMFANFLFTGGDAIGNQLSKMRMMTGGQLEIPVTYIAGYGGEGARAAQHSDCVHSILMNLGGIDVAMPSNSADAKGLMKTALRSKRPNFFLEPLSRGGERGEVPDGEHLVPFGKARVAREGRDVSIISVGTMMKPVLQAADDLAEQGIDVEVVDLRTVVPLDKKAIVETVRRTGKLVVVDESRDRCGPASHVAAVAADLAFQYLKAPIRRVTNPNIAIPYAPVAEAAAIPNAERIAKAVRDLVAVKEVA